MSPIDKRPYRKGVGMMVLNVQGYAFAGQRIDNQSHDAWQLPQGGLDEGESPQDAALRELYEETGIRQVTVIAESQDWYSYDFPAYLSDKLWNGAYKGQMQKWFLLSFHGGDHDINIYTSKPEFSKWAWINPMHLPNLIVPFKKGVYTSVLSEFMPYIHQYGYR